MKFNPQLKQELNRYEKVMATESSPTTASIRKTNEQPIPPKLRYPTGEKVVGGDILRKPIDRAAAMLVAKAPWWAHPPQVFPTQTNKQAPKPRKKNPMSEIKHHKGKAPKWAGPNAQIVTEKSNDQYNAELAGYFVNQTDKTLDETQALLEKAIDARAAMDTMCNTWKTSWLDFIDTGNERLKELRMTRMAMDTEMRQLMAGLREVRQFFLDKDYETEVARLKEFVDTCERLKALKDSGFLDTVADTMLRLADK